MCPEMYTWSNTVLFASYNEELKNQMIEFCAIFGKKIFHSEPGSNDIFNVPCFCVVVDTEYTGQSQWQEFSRIMHNDETLKNIPVLDTNELSPEHIMRRLREVVLQQIGIFTYPHSKKHEVTIRNTAQPENAEVPVAFDTMKELKNALRILKATSLTLGTINKISGKPAIRDFGINPEKLSDSHLRWISAPDKLHQRLIFV
ncbi:MAG: hypothetical protein WCM76_02680 [Bacteroidota bacterium]